MRKFNPVKKYWDERKGGLSTEKQQQLKQLSDKGYMTDELVFIKRTRPKLKPGDVFVVQPKENTYFYGLVLRVCSVPDCSYLIIACIFRNITHQMTMDDFKADFQNLLLPPLRLFKEPWTSGYFHNIGFVDLSTLAIPTYAFYHMATGSVVTADSKNYPDQMPELIGMATMGGVGSVAYKITQELIIDPHILEDGRPQMQADFCLKFPRCFWESVDYK